MWACMCIIRLVTTLRKSQNMHPLMCIFTFYYIKQSVKLLKHISPYDLHYTQQDVSNQRCANPGCYVILSSKICMMVPNICGSFVWNSFGVNLLAPIIFMVLLDLTKICATCLKPHTLKSCNKSCKYSSQNIMKSGVSGALLQLHEFMPSSSLCVCSVTFYTMAIHNASFIQCRFKPITLYLFIKFLNLTYSSCKYEVHGFLSPALVQAEQNRISVTDAHFLNITVPSCT